MKDVIGDLGINIDDAQVDDILKEAKKPDEDKEKDGKDADKKDKKWNQSLQQRSTNHMLQWQ